jgi:hypothetical protein
MLQVVVAMVSVGRWCMVGAPLSRRGVTTSNFFATNAKKREQKRVGFRRFSLLFLPFGSFFFSFCL